MKIHYYLGWFNGLLPQKLAKALDEDIAARESLVMVSAHPSVYEETGACERAWLEQAGIRFKAYHLLDGRTGKADAQALINGASAILLLGGSPVEQNAFLKEYALADPIRQSGAVVLGASAGAINMGAKWLCSKSTGFDVEHDTLYDGAGLDDFSVLSHIDLDNNLATITQALLPLSAEMNVYLSNKDCALRVKQGAIDVVGDIYLVAHARVHKLAETL